MNIIMVKKCFFINEGLTNVQQEIQFLHFNVEYIIILQVCIT